ncbi:MAG: heme-binding protein [Erythrobacter sp.]
MRKSKWIAGGLGLLALGAAFAWAQYRSIETPEFEELASEDDFALREYAPMVVAEVTHTGDRSRSLNAGFRRLAAYIFAEDRPGEEIAMTSPVMQDSGEEIAMTAPVMQNEAETGAWRTRFVMPARYTLETLPEPPEDITLTQVPSRRMAAVRFSGRGEGPVLREQETRLRQWIAGRGLSASGPAEYAFYDAPMVPPPLRRNEVLIPVE